MLGPLPPIAGTYYVTRRLDRVLAHACSDRGNKLALERNVLRTVTDNIPDSIFAKDKDGRIPPGEQSLRRICMGLNPRTIYWARLFSTCFPKERASALHDDDLARDEVRRGGQWKRSGPRSTRKEM